jgi:hypothetical protein
MRVKLGKQTGGFKGESAETSLYVATPPCFKCSNLIAPQVGGVTPIVRCLTPNNRKKIIEIALALVASVGNDY